MRDRRGDRQRGVHSREDIGNGDATFCGPPLEVVAFPVMLMSRHAWKMKS